MYHRKALSMCEREESEREESEDAALLAQPKKRPKPGNDRAFQVPRHKGEKDSP